MPTHLTRPACLRQWGSNVPTVERLGQKCLDPLEVMELLKIRRTTLYNWCNRGLLEVSKIGNRLYVDIDDVTDMLERRKGKKKR